VAGSDTHPKAIRLFDLARAQVRQRAFSLTDEETQHVGQCQECQDIIAVFARQFAEPTAADGKPRMEHNDAE
jgi:hypothetical protein